MLQTATELLLQLPWKTLPGLKLVHMLASEPKPELVQELVLA